MKPGPEDAPQPTRRRLLHTRLTFRKLVSAHEYDALGEDFENKEHELFGKGGFEKRVDRRVSGTEKQFGLYDSAQFTRRV